MTIPNEQPASVRDALSLALGHIRNATAALLDADDQSTDTLLMGIASLELQSLFGDVWPMYVDNGLTAAESLAEAERVLGEVVDDVSLAVWAALRSLREQVSRGQH